MRKLKDQIPALPCGKKHSLATVKLAFRLHNVPGFYQLLENASQALLRDFENIEEFGNGKARPSVHKEKCTVMGASSSGNTSATNSGNDPT